MALSKEEVSRIAELARLKLDDGEVEKFTTQLSYILEQFQILQEVDTTDIPPTAQATPIKNVLRKDEVKPSLSVEEVLANAPDREGDFLRINTVLG